MNREQAKQLLPIIQAFADGAKVQFQNQFKAWITSGDEPSFSALTEWRIKPKPLELWITVWADGNVESITTHASELEARERARASECERRVAHMCEVTE